MYNAAGSQTQNSEMVKLVDENNNEIGVATRGKVRTAKLWHRVSYIFVITTKKELLVQVRSQRKDYCPGFFDLASAGGVVDAGEDDDLGARRELQEELGLVIEGDSSGGSGLQMSKILTAKYEPADGSDKLFQNIYLIKNFDSESTELVLQESEVDRVDKWAVSDIEGKLKDPETFKVTPDSHHAWQQLCEKLQNNFD